MLEMTVQESWSKESPQLVFISYFFCVAPTIRQCSCIRHQKCVIINTIWYKGCEEYYKFYYWYNDDELLNAYCWTHTQKQTCEEVFFTGSRWIPISLKLKFFIFSIFTILFIATFIMNRLVLHISGQRPPFVYQCLLIFSH